MHRAQLLLMCQQQLLQLRPAAAAADGVSERAASQHWRVLLLVEGRRSLG
jgi:hypothetical protein